MHTNFYCLESTIFGLSMLNLSLNINSWTMKISEWDACLLLQWKSQNGKSLVLWFLFLLVFVWMSAVVLLCIYFLFIRWSKPCFNFQCCFMIGMQTWDDNHGIGCSSSISMYLIEHKFGHLDVYQYMGTMKIISKTS